MAEVSAKPKADSIEANPEIQDKSIFIGGNSRSGTTLMGQLLERNSDVFTFEELHFFNSFCSGRDISKPYTKKHTRKLLKDLLAVQAGDFISPVYTEVVNADAEEILDKYAPQTTFTLASLFKIFLAEKTLKQNKSIPCEQTPANIFHINEILDSFPESRIINMVRDPRDVLLSQKYKWRIRFLGATNIPYREAIRSWLNYHPITISKLWNSSIQAGERFANHPRVLTVRFEDLITQPEETLQTVCSFIDIPYSDQLLNVSQSEGGVSSHKKITSKKKGIDRNAIAKWKKGGLSVTELHLCQQITKDYRKLYNYDSDPIQANPVSVIFQCITLPIKLFFAILFNLKRARNLLAIIKKRL